MPIRESHECVRSRRRIQLNQCLKLFDGPFRLAGHEIALAQRGVEIDTLRRDFQAGFQERDRIFKIILRHADPCQKKDDVRIQRSQLVESGLKIAPQRVDLYAALGESYFMSGKAERAIEEFKTLIQLDPSPRSYTFMGLSYRHLGRFDEARKYFQEGLKKDPRNASCLFNLGYIEERQGNHTRAEELFQQALRSNPDFSEALLELANLRIANKRLEEAAELLRRYVKVSRNAASGYYKLAMVERSLHQLTAAQRDLNVFQTLSKDASPGPYPNQHLFDYLNTPSNLSPQLRTHVDLTKLTDQIRKHPANRQALSL